MGAAMTTYRTRRHRQRAQGTPARRNLAAALTQWLIVLLLTAAIVLMLSSPLLQPL